MVYNNLLTDQDVLTFEEVRSFLRVSKESLDSEIASGRLQAVRIGEEVRILKTDLLEFLELAKRYEASTGGTPSEVFVPYSEPKWFDLELNPAEPFSHRWPSNDQEHYGEAHAGTARLGRAVLSVSIGFTERESIGKLRKRSVVFVEKRPLAEFVAADDFEDSQLMVSLLKHRNGKQIRPTETIPPEYKHMRIEPYNKHVTGPYASSNLAVVCRESDLSVMVEHALLRMKRAEARK